MKIDTRELLERLSTSRREFNATAFAELDRNLSDEEREEWNAIYASFSSRSLMRNTVIGLETIPFPTDEDAEQELTCMVVMRHLVKVLIPLPLFWLEPTGINPNSVIGAEIDYIIIGVDREGECAVAARSLALEQQRWHALNVQHISEGDVVSASVLACGSDPHYSDGLRLRCDDGTAGDELYLPRGYAGRISCRPAASGESAERERGYACAVCS